MALGIIRHANQNQDSIDNWAVVLDGVVQNVFISSYNQLSATVIASYDYLIDISVSMQSASPGWNYDPTNDTFSDPYNPPPTNWSLVVQQDFDSALYAIQQIVSDAVAGGLSSADIQTAYTNCVTNDNPGLDNATSMIMSQINSYVQGGG
jgi:hypothetical protein